MPRIHLEGAREPMFIIYTEGLGEEEREGKGENPEALTFHILG